MLGVQKELEGVLLVDKPGDHTSHDVIARLRGKLRMRKIGHAGTLDPMATGLLIVLLGRATRVSQYLISLDKEYEGTIELGKITDSQDAEGQVMETRPVPPLSESDVRAAMQGFLGDQYQTPPMFSAIKIGGVPLYKRARKGEEVEREPRFIRVMSVGTSFASTCQGSTSGCAARRAPTCGRSPTTLGQRSGAAPASFRAPAHGHGPVQCLAGPDARPDRGAPDPRDREEADTRAPGGSDGRAMSLPAQFDGLDRVALPPRPLHIAIGMFDGVHLGHRIVVESAVQSARISSGVSMVLTFSPHPSVLFRPDNPTRMILDLPSKLAKLGSLGVDAVVVQPFTREFAAVTAEDFVPLIKRHLPALAGIYVGENFRFGRGRAGDVALLVKEGQRHGIAVFSAPRVNLDGEPISSTRIRERIRAGDLGGAAALSAMSTPPRAR